MPRTRTTAWDQTSNALAGSSLVTDKLTKDIFRRRFRAGLIAAWLIPPTTAELGMTFLGFWTLEEAGLNLIRFTGVYVTAFTLIAFFVFKYLVIEPVVALGDHQPALVPAHIRRLKAFPWVFWGLLSLYCGFGPATVLLSNAVFQGTQYTLGQYAFSAFGVIPFLLISAFPLFFYLTDLLGRFLAPRGITVMVAPLWLKVLVLGLFTPVMIDSILLTYYFDRTGFLVTETIVLWFVLVLLAAAGTWVALRSFHQGMRALKQPLGNNIEAGITAYPVPSSLDEFGLLARGWADLLQARDHAERQVKERDKRTRDIIDDASDAIISLDDKHRIILFNKQAETAFGYRSEEVIGGHLDILLPSRFHQAHRGNVNDFAAGNVSRRLMSQRAELYGLRKNSEEFPVEVTISKLEQEGQLILTAVIRDITDRKRAEEGLKQYARQQGIVAGLGQQALTGTGLQDLMDEAVAAVAQTLDLEYVKVLELLPEGDALLLKAGVGWKAGLVGTATVSAGGESQAGYTLLSNEPVVVEDLRTETRFKGPLLLHDHGVVSGTSLIIHGQNRPFGILGTHTAKQRLFTKDDIHFLQAVANVLSEAIERKRAEGEREELIAELEAKNAEMERFTYAVSHDLKSPLITIQGFAGLLEKDAAEKDAERIKGDVKQIHAAVGKMQQLLDELLELSRIGRLVNLSQEVSLGDLVHEAVEIVAGRISERGVQVEISPNLPLVFGDRPRLLEVLQNLIDNAVKFMGNQPEPRIEIGVKQEGEESICFVRDNGMGIKPRYHEKVFELFDRLNQEIEGTGIGLTLVKRIVEIHGERVWIESEGERRGCTFCFTIPRKGGSSSHEK